jgi:hypothetical protein
MHSLSIFGALMSHMQTQIHKIHHRLILRGNHHLPPYRLLCAWPWDQHPNVILSWIPKLESQNSLNWDSRNFLMI